MKDRYVKFSTLILKWKTIAVFYKNEAKPVDKSWIPTLNFIFMYSSNANRFSLYLKMAAFFLFFTTENAENISEWSYSTVRVTLFGTLGGSDQVTRRMRIAKPAELIFVWKSCTHFWEFVTRGFDICIQTVPNSRDIACVYVTCNWHLWIADFAKYVWILFVGKLDCFACPKYISVNSPPKSSVVADTRVSARPFWPVR